MDEAEIIKRVESRIENLQQNVLASAQIQQNTMMILAHLKDLLLQHQTAQLQANHPNPLNRFGQKCFSQTDEDGITIEIVRRLDVATGVYAEFGVGNGLENNTLILAAMGWRGFWVGGSDLAFDYSKATRFRYIKDWITRGNIVRYAEAGQQALGASGIDYLSLDLDGNDIYFMDELLANGVRPKIAVVEYNAKFPPPARFQIAYDAQHKWRGDDYFGAALANFVELFQRYGYKLVCCNAHSGTNAFFVHGDFAHLFADVPTRIGDIYMPPRYHLYTAHGHKQSTKVVEALLNH